MELFICNILMMYFLSMMCCRRCYVFIVCQMSLSHHASFGTREYKLGILFFLFSRFEYDIDILKMLPLLAAHL